MMSLAALAVFRPEPRLFELGNMVGPTTESLLHGEGLTACTTEQGTPGNPICFHAGRMPIASFTVALGIRLFGMRPLAVNLFKLLLLLAPLAGAMALVCRGSRGGRWLTGALLLLPFAITAFLADVVNMQVEEGYSYSLLALAVALLLYFHVVPGPEWMRAVAFAVAADGVYLSKSSMFIVLLVLLAGFWRMERGTMLRWVVAVLVLGAPAGWAMHQHHASGRYSVGTSLDGMNLHKSNSPEFLQLYPPPAGESLDGHDQDLNAGLHFGDEWSYNDYHARAAFAYMRAHPREELKAGARKLWVIFVSVHKVGSSETRGWMKVVEVGGLALFRVLLWAAMGGAGWSLVRGGANRKAEAIFLGVVGAVTLPYLVGFAYTRHVSVLIYPSAVMCCWLIHRWDAARAGFITAQTAESL